MSYAVFDIGGTKTRVALTEDFETFTDSVSFSTPKSFAPGIQALIEAITNLNHKTPLKGIAGGIRGVLMEDKSGISGDGILSDWVDQSITDALTSEFNVPAFLENDTAVAGLGEAVYGAGKGMDIIAFHTISTGVGGVKIEQGQIDMATSGFEPGHQVLDIDRTILGEDVTPTLENLVSGTGLENRLGMKPKDIPQSDMVWDELAGYLAQGLRNTILYWSPEVIVLGGSMILGDPKIELDAIRKHTVDVLDGFVDCPFITTATLKDEAGLYGAMAYLQQRLEN